MVRDGYIYGLSLLAVALVLVWATGNWSWGSRAAPVGSFFSMVFPRPRTDRFQLAMGLIVSPGDGLVTETVTISTPEGTRHRDQHLPECLRRTCEPLADRGVHGERLRYQKGQYVNAMNPVSAERNEQNAVTVRGEGMEVTFKQIAGLVGTAHRIQPQRRATRWSADSASA